MDDNDITRAERLQGFAGRALGRLPAGVQLGLSLRRQIEVDGQRLDPCLQLVLAVSRRRNAPGLCEPDPSAARARYRREILIFGGPRTPVGAVRDLEIQGAAGYLRARHYAPPGTAAGRDLLVYLHGGGFVIGDLETHDEPCRMLCLHASTHVLSVEYRLAPEHPFPAGLHDAVSALRWAQENAAALGADPARVSVGGDSAGGNLAAVVAQLCAREAPPAAQMLVYPATDGMREYASKGLFGRGYFLDRPDCEEFFRHYLDGTGASEDDPRVSPLRARDFSGLPPALVVTAGFDMLRDEGDAYARRLSEAGCRAAWRRFPSLTHGFIHVTGVCPSAHAALAEVARDWRELLDTTRTELPRERVQKEPAT